MLPAASLARSRRVCGPVGDGQAVPVEGHGSVRVARPDGDGVTVDQQVHGLDSVVVGGRAGHRHRARDGRGRPRGSSP